MQFEHIENINWKGVRYEDFRTGVLMCMWIELFGTEEEVYDSLMEFSIECDWNWSLARSVFLLIELKNMGLTHI